MIEAGEAALGEVGAFVERGLNGKEARLAGWRSALYRAMLDEKTSLGGPAVAPARARELFAALALDVAIGEVTIRALRLRRTASLDDPVICQGVIELEVTVRGGGPNTPVARRLARRRVFYATARAGEDAKDLDSAVVTLLPDPLGEVIACSAAR